MNAPIGNILGCQIGKIYEDYKNSPYRILSVVAIFGFNVAFFFFESSIVHKKQFRNTNTYLGKLQ